MPTAGRTDHLAITGTTDLAAVPISGHTEGAWWSAGGCTTVWGDC